MLCTPTLRRLFPRAGRRKEHGSSQAAPKKGLRHQPTAVSPRSVFGHYPYDLIIYILEIHFGHQIGVPEDLFDIETDDNPVDLVISRDYPAQSRLCHLSLLNKHWHSVLVPLLFLHPVLSSASAARKFIGYLNAKPSLSTYVKGVVILDLTDDLNNESFFSAVYCGTDDVRRQTESALLQILSLQESGLLRVVFVTKQPKGVIDTSERSGTLMGWQGWPHSLFNRGKRHTALNNIRALTLHGFASHLLYTFSSTRFDPSSMAFTHLEHLSLQNIFLNNIGWPHTPCLKKLSITHCNFAALPSLPSLKTAPELHTIAWFENQAWQQTEDELQLIPCLLPHSTKISSLAIDFEFYGHLSSSCDFYHSFPRLQELSLHKCWGAARHNAAAWTAGVIRSRLPAKLGILRVSEANIALQVMVALDAEHGERILSYLPPMYATCRGAYATCVDAKYDLVVTGYEAFWNTVPRWRRREELLAWWNNNEVMCTYSFWDGNARG